MNRSMLALLGALSLLTGAGAAVAQVAPLPEAQSGPAAYAPFEAMIGKSAEEFWLTEMGLVVSEIDHTLKHLRRWLAPRRVSVPLRVQPGQARIVREHGSGSFSAMMRLDSAS